MSCIQDPIADLLTRVRNAQSAKKAEVCIPYSGHKLAICQLLQAEGYINAVSVDEQNPKKKNIHVVLKYFEGQPVMRTLKRVSKPSLRQYVAKGEIKKVPGFGIAVISTSHGVMTHQAANKAGLGGEVLCIVN
jgi:small subunit ribosomal protein S8